MRGRRTGVVTFATTTSARKARSKMLADLAASLSADWSRRIGGEHRVVYKVRAWTAGLVAQARYHY